MYHETLDANVPNISDIQIEELFLGNILREPERLKVILSEITLLPEAFFSSRTRAVYNEILRLFEQGILPEIYQVQSRLNGDCPEDYALSLANTTKAIDLNSYASRLVELSSWRKRRRSAIGLLEAISQRDLELYSRARAIADDDGVDQTSFYTPERLAEDFKTFIADDGVDAMPLPWLKMNDGLGGGFRRKQFTVLGGWTSHGKSIVVDNIGRFIAAQGYNVHLYMNEMGHEERTARLISMETGINLKHLLAGDLTKESEQKVNTALVNLPFSITPCAGWSVEQLTFDVRSKNHDLIIIDIIHQFDYDSESELARISRLLTRVAKQANCHVLATVHLNEFRANDVVKPRPVTRDIRGSGMLQRDPDNVMFIHREQDPYTGDPLAPATLYTAKVRNGSLCHQDLMFNPSYMSFEDESLYAR